MVEKLAQAGQGGGVIVHPFQPITITYKVAVYTPAERAGTLSTLPLFISTPMYSVVETTLPLELYLCTLSVNPCHREGTINTSHH
jgi:hypothetical protein